MNNLNNIIFQKFETKEYLNYDTEQLKFQTLILENQFINSLNSKQLEMFNKLLISKKQLDKLISLELIEFVRLNYSDDK